MQNIKELEISDDDEDIAFPIDQEQQDVGGDQLQYRVAWDSSSSRRKIPTHTVDVASTSGTYLIAEELKNRGNAAFSSGDYITALALYKEAIQQCEAASTPQEFNQLGGILYSNVAATMLRLNRPSDAAAAARKAHALRPSWTKPLHRLAEAHSSCGELPAAIAACLKGETLCAVNSEGHTEFTLLLDTLAVAAAAKGSAAGFTGRQLEVRSAGEEAWLGRPAPHVPTLDGPLDEESALPSDDLSTTASTATTTAGLLLTNTPSTAPPSSSTSITPPKETSLRTSARTDALSNWHYSDTLVAARRQRTSFRCIREAVAAARDGDRITLLRGVHNAMGQSIDINKRLLVQGEGALGETVIDQRANCPTFKITRGGVVIRNIEIDHTGFREALLVEGGASVAPLIDGCVIKCSGDDAVNVGGAAAPLLRRCAVTGKKCGIRAFEQSSMRLEGCTIEKCGEQALKAMENSKIDATLCMLRDCQEEGAVVMDSAALSLLACTVTGNQGPGVDCSGAGAVEIRGGEVAGNVGGVWLWDASRAVLDGVRLNGGRAPVILADGEARPVARSCVIKGTVHAPDEAWKGLLGGGGGGGSSSSSSSSSTANSGTNRLEDPDVPTDFPPEEGPFRFVPNRFTRKQ